MERVFGFRPIFRAGKTPKIPFLVFLCSQTPRKRLLRRLPKNILQNLKWKCNSCLEKLLSTPPPPKKNPSLSTPCPAFYRSIYYFFLKHLAKLFIWFIFLLPLSFHDHNQVHVTVLIKHWDVENTHKQTKLSHCGVFLKASSNFHQRLKETKIQQSSKLINSTVTRDN